MPYTFQLKSQRRPIVIKGGIDASWGVDPMDAEQPRTGRRSSPEAVRGRRPDLNDGTGGVSVTVQGKVLSAVRLSATDQSLSGA